MKKLFKFATLGTVLLVSMFFAGCKSINALSLRGYEYKMDSITPSGSGSSPVHDISPQPQTFYEDYSTLKFTGDRTVVWKIEGNSYEGSYEINEGDSTVQIATNGPSATFSYTGKGKTLTTRLNNLGRSYTADGREPYTVVYKVKGKL